MISTCFRRPKGARTLIRSVLLSVTALLLSATLVAADPNLLVTYPGGVPKVQIEGDYAHSTYTILRATKELGPYVAITSHNVLCLGSCFADDRTALPAVDYYYRFDLALPNGTLASYGPYLVSFSSKLLRVVQARVYPNPASGPATLEFYLAGEASQAGLSADASLFDAQGRRVRNLFRGTLPRGMTSMQWDGLDERGRTLGAGLYFLRFSTPAGNSVTRVMRSQ
jgi:hypothetical protein